jgi:hypothetical protein
MMPRLELLVVIKTPAFSVAACPVDGNNNVRVPRPSDRAIIKFGGNGWMIRVRVEDTDHIQVAICVRLSVPGASLSVQY